MKRILFAIILIATPLAKASSPNIYEDNSRSAVESSIRFSAIERYNQTSPRGNYGENTHNIDVFLLKGKALPRDIQRCVVVNDEELYYIVCISDKKLQSNNSPRTGGGVFYAIFDAHSLELLNSFRTR